MGLQVAHVRATRPAIQILFALFDSLSITLANVVCVSLRLCSRIAPPIAPNALAACFTKEKDVDVDLNNSTSALRKKDMDCEAGEDEASAERRASRKYMTRNKCTSFLPKTSSSHLVSLNS